MQTAISRTIGSGFLDNFASTLAALFICMRVGGMTDWAWGWVLAPIWGYILYIGLISSIQDWYQRRLLNEVERKRDQMIRGQQ